MKRQEDGPRRVGPLLVILFVLAMTTSGIVGFVLGRNIEPSLGRRIDVIEIDGDHDQKEKTIHFSGQIFYQDGRPYANGKVRLHSTPRETRTDEKGCFFFPNVEIGEHTLSLIDDGENVLAGEHIDLRKISDLQELKIEKQNNGQYTMNVSMDVRLIEIGFKIRPEKGQLELLSDRSAALSDLGVLFLSGRSMALSDGPVVLSSGMVILMDGTVVLPQKVILPDQSILSNEEGYTTNDGTKITPAGTVILPNGITVQAAENPLQLGIMASGDGLSRFSAVKQQDKTVGVTNLQGGRPATEKYPLKDQFPQEGEPNAVEPPKPVENSDKPPGGTTDKDQIAPVENPEKEVEPPAGTTSPGSDHGGSTVIPEERGRLDVIGQTVDGGWSGAWESTSVIDLFYHHDGFTDNGSHIMPGVGGYYLFQLKNSRQEVLSYEITLTEGKLHLPLRFRLGPQNGKALLSWSDTIVKGQPLHLCTGEIGAGESMLYRLDWKWPYDSGDDVADSKVGSLPDHERLYTLNITVHVGG